uniref:Calpain catalytic domain-containing protein n=1 Tax=Chromera velia CCMP2878 TaxID=1169474 RepID=A0A0G4F3V6_9ALVE|eukprot:Cvel_2679.t1-p1 / transcript=Cvel_2679.t1 / gene=Cvel_2679 / organism=Chromera_velia_CCMP2878 / gene_product=hypothetical protein / transcript_product=hypothetical protein / location=Cvel_scaffold107:39082-49442(-) / protein_length=766 / sequence_SO=supercontig / SO=protein_coding / is_pseudo=false
MKRIRQSSSSTIRFFEGCLEKPRRDGVGPSQKISVVSFEVAPADPDPSLRLQDRRVLSFCSFAADPDEQFLSTDDAIDSFGSSTGLWDSEVLSFDPYTVTLMLEGPEVLSVANSTDSLEAERQPDSVAPPSQHIDSQEQRNVGKGKGSAGLDGQTEVKSCPLPGLSLSVSVSEVIDALAGTAQSRCLRLDSEQAGVEYRNLCLTDTLLRTLETLYVSTSPSDSLWKRWERRLKKSQERPKESSSESLRAFLRGWGGRETWFLSAATRPNLIEWAEKELDPILDRDRRESLSLWRETFGEGMQQQIHTPPKPESYTAAPVLDLFEGGSRSVSWEEGSLPDTPRNRERLRFFLDQLQQRGVKFYDPLFSPEGEDLKDRIETDSVMRASEVVQKLGGREDHCRQGGTKKMKFKNGWGLCADTAHFSDVMQNGLGNCQILSFLMSLVAADSSHLQREIFPFGDTLADSGLCVVRLWSEGRKEWRLVVVDDFIPVHTQLSESDHSAPKKADTRLVTPCNPCAEKAATADDPCTVITLTYANLRWWRVLRDDGSLLASRLAFWPVLLLKAMAKLTGSFKKVEAGWQFSGDRQRSIFFGPSSFHGAFLYGPPGLGFSAAQRIGTSFKSGFPETVATPMEPERSWSATMHPAANFNETGLIWQHAYAVVGALTLDELGVGDRSASEWGILVSNPHGVTWYDWKGRLSLQSAVGKESQRVQEILMDHILPPGIRIQDSVRQKRFLQSEHRPSLFLLSGSDLRTAFEARMPRLSLE